MIKIYATALDYSEHGTGVLNANEVQNYLELASIDINRAALTKIEKKGFENLTEQQKGLIKKAVCLQAEHLKEEGIYDNDDVASFSIRRKFNY